MSETKQYDFRELADYLQAAGLAMRSTAHMNLAGFGRTALLKQDGADEMAANLVKVSAWLGRLEEYLNAEGKGDPPRIVITPSAVTTTGGVET